MTGLRYDVFVTPAIPQSSGPLNLPAPLVGLDQRKQCRLPSERRTRPDTAWPESSSAAPCEATTCFPASP